LLNFSDPLGTGVFNVLERERVRKREREGERERVKKRK
jgi:hypothetical protein